jgi:hypothetical protein
MATDNARKPPVRAWQVTVWHPGDLLPGPALARRARPWVRHPEVMAGPNSTSPNIGWGGMVYSFKSFWGH